jgi:hypothetical protein
MTVMNISPIFNLILDIFFLWNDNKASKHCKVKKKSKYDVTEAYGDTELKLSALHASELLGGVKFIRPLYDRAKSHRHPMNKSLLKT